MLATYEGTTEGLRSQIVELEQALDIMTRVSPTVKKRVINNFEAKLIAIIQLAAESNDSYDNRWLAASRIEIYNIFQNFETIRLEINKPITDPKHNLYMQDLKTRFSDRDEIFDTAEVKKAARGVASAIYGVATAATAAAVTAASAPSFIAGPLLGGAVTGGTALLTFSVAAVVTKRAMDKAEKVASETVETTLRSTFTYK